MLSVSTVKGWGPPAWLHLSCALCTPGQPGQGLEGSWLGAAQAGSKPWESSGDGLGLCGPLWLQGWVSGSLVHLCALCLAEDPTFRCEECDELFQCRLDLRRHKKYACSSAGAPLYEGLGEELKPELGGGSDGQAHECKDCERMFPNKYRCRPPRPPPAPPVGSPLGSPASLPVQPEV